MTSFLRLPLLIALAAIISTATPAHAQVVFFNGSVSNDYSTGANWSGGTVPDTANGALAIINNNANFPVTYDATSSLIIGNGGQVEVLRGSFTEVGGNNPITLNGNGTFIVQGATFNQGTSTGNPFNINGTGNNVYISSGATANFNQNLQLNSGLTFYVGGDVNLTNGELDFNNLTSSMNFGNLNTTLMNGLNAANSVFTLSGGNINLSGTVGLEGGTSNYINFTTNSFGTINFSNSAITTAVATDFITSGAVEYNGTVDTNHTIFKVTSSGGVTTISLLPTPEPSTYALLGLGLLALTYLSRRRQSR